MVNPTKTYPPPPAPYYTENFSLNVPNSEINLSDGEIDQKYSVKKFNRVFTI